MNETVIGAVFLICFTIGFCMVYICDTWIKVEQIRKQKEVKDG